MDEKYMALALELAERGRGWVNPNPLVGAVIVKEGKIISEGWHARYGEAHAEAKAIRNATESVEGATLYVTLEPCAHFGKTPPCAQTIVAHKIAKVVIGMRDPNPLVSGKGIEILKANGIEVTVGLMATECMAQNEVFIKYITRKIPFVLLKTAMTLDGKIASISGDAKWISGVESRRYVHEIRQSMSGIMVGIGTVLNDDPELTVRLEGIRPSHPVRIVVDSLARTPIQSKVMQNLDRIKTIVATTQAAPEEKVKALEEKGANVWRLPLANGHVDLQALMIRLGEAKIDGIMLEGGSELNFSFLESGLVDKVMVFIAPKIIGGSDAKTPVGGRGLNFMRDAIALDRMTVQKIDQDVVIEGYVVKE